MREPDVHCSFHGTEAFTSSTSLLFPQLSPIFTAVSRVNHAYKESYSSKVVSFPGNNFPPARWYNTNVILKNTELFPDVTLPRRATQYYFPDWPMPQAKGTATSDSEEQTKDESVPGERRLSSPSLPNPPPGPASLLCTKKDN